MDRGATEGDEGTGSIDRIAEIRKRLNFDMRTTSINIEILRIDGRREMHQIDKQHSMRAIYRLIGCDCGDSVNLRDGRVMIVDDTGLPDGKPINPQATELYWSIYPRAQQAGQPIAGDVAIAVDEDFA